MLIVQGNCSSCNLWQCTLSYHACLKYLIEVGGRENNGHRLGVKAAGAAANLLPLIKVHVLHVLHWVVPDTVSTFQWSWPVTPTECLSVNLYLLEVNIHLTSQASYFACL